MEPISPARGGATDPTAIGGAAVRTLCQISKMFFNR